MNKKGYIAGLQSVSGGTPKGNCLQLSFTDLVSFMSSRGLNKNVNSWNDFFQLPSYGSKFNYVDIENNKVFLYNTGTITLRPFLFYNDTYIIGIYDYNGIILSLGDACFRLCSSLTTVIVPYVQSIGTYSFLQANLSGGYKDFSRVQTIGAYAFQSSLIDSAYFPNLVNLGAYSFYNCINLYIEELPKLLSVESYTFRGCSSLIDLSLPLVTSIGDYAFQNSGIRIISIPLCHTITVSGFIGCINLEAVNAPNLIQIGFTCFSGCIKLNSEFPNLETIGNGGFQNCSSQNINFPRLLTVNTYGFNMCTGTTEIYLPSVQNLGESSGYNSVFYGITGKTLTVTVPSYMMVCNGGNPDADIQLLQANNTVTIRHSTNYGRLYNYFTLVDANGLAPDGWHVPTELEYSMLASYVAPENPPYLAGAYLKEAGTEHWSIPNAGANNSSGFSFRGKGYRGVAGLYLGNWAYGYLWSCSDGIPGLPTSAYCRYSRYDDTVFMFFSIDKRCGLSVRFVRNNDTGWVEGEQLIDQDGFVYDTVKIGTQIWTVQNYACTKYKNGVSIPYVSDNSVWAALATGAYCDFNNNLALV